MVASRYVFFRLLFFSTCAVHTWLRIATNHLDSLPQTASDPLRTATLASSFRLNAKNSTAGFPLTPLLSRFRAFAVPGVTAVWKRAASRLSSAKSLPPIRSPVPALPAVLTHLRIQRLQLSPSGQITVLPMLDCAFRNPRSVCPGYFIPLLRLLPQKPLLPPLVRLVPTHKLRNNSEPEHCHLLFRFFVHLLPPGLVFYCSQGGHHV